MSCLSKGFACLALEAASHPPFCADFHTYPPIEALRHCEGARNTEVTGGIGVACAHDPRSGQKGHIDTDGVIEEGPARTTGVATSH